MTPVSPAASAQGTYPVGASSAPAATATMATASRPKTCEQATTTTAGSRRDRMPPRKSALPQSTLDSRASRADTG